MKKWTVGLVMVVLVGMMTGQVFGATWTGGGDGSTWTDPANWGAAAYPGAGAGDTTATINNGDTVELATDLPTLTGLELYGNSRLNMRSGTVLTNNPSLSSAPISASGATWYIEDGTIDPGGMFGSRNLSTSTTTSLFWQAGGSLVNPDGGSGNRFEICHGDNHAWGIYKQTGGVFTNSGFVMLSGNTTAHTQLLLQGGRFHSVLTYVGSDDASDGLQCLLEVTGSVAGGGPSYIYTGNSTFYRNDANVTGSSIIRFVADANGVTPIQCSTLNLGATAGRKGDLEVDLSSYDLDASGDVVELFQYTTLSNGAFGSTNITGVSSYTLDYNYNGEGKIALKDLRLPPDGTLFMQK